MEKLKETGDHHDATQTPGPADSREARSNVPAAFVIVPLPEEFDFDSMFPSESQAAASAAPAPFTGSTGAHDSVSHEVTAAASLSIADLIENHVRLEWHEAVAIAQHLCRVMVRDPGANVHHSLIEPWNVEITNAGDVQVVPAGSSSDPLVKQVGRVLQALLQEVVAPAELRLVASQASFEVPVYASVDQLSAALRHFERPGDLASIRAAFHRGLEAKFSTAQTTAGFEPVGAKQADESSWIPKAPPATLPSLRRIQSRLSLRPIAAAAVILIAGSLLFIRLRPRLVEDPSPVLRREVAEPRVQSQSAPVRETEAAVSHVPAPPAIVTDGPTIPRAPNTSAATISHRVLAPAAGTHAVRLPATAPPPSIAANRHKGETLESVDAEDRASSLLGSGRANEAAIVFDALVMRDPFHQLDPARSGAEAMSLFRRSKAALLPILARGHYQEAQAAFDAADFSLAIAEGERAMALLGDVDARGEGSDLQGKVAALLAAAAASRTSEEERIYTIADAGVTPPRPLGRQLSTPRLLWTSVPPTGRLQILIGRSGRVETVRLDTPSNGYHDRMIVSAVKAWHYKPALRNGKPVRFSLVMTIHLPDS